MNACPAPTSMIAADDQQYAERRATSEYMRSRIDGAPAARAAAVLELVQVGLIDQDTAREMLGD